MPLYQLLGGQVRHGADCYFHASGSSFSEVEENARRAMEQGFRHVRVQVATPGYAGYGARGNAPAEGARNEVVGPTSPRDIWEPAPYVRLVPKLFEHLRTKLGDDVELLHDVHERVTLNQAINLCKALEPYRLFFLEDPLPPEDNDHFRLLRQQTSTPLAMGELSTHSRNTCPSSYNFGVHEGSGFLKETQEVFAGCPEIKIGYMLAQERPGLGIEVDENLAAKFPIPAGPPNFEYSWETTRRRDGTVIP